MHPEIVMPDAAASSPWADLPSDLLSDVSGRFHTTSDYVHFHAVCKPWRNSIPPPASRPAHLPWLLARRDDRGRQKALCVFSSKKKPHRAAASEICFPDRRWAISAKDGTATRWLVTSSSYKSRGLNGGPLNGSAAAVPLPRFQDEIRSWEESAVSVASSDATIIVYGYGLIWNCGGFSFDVALRRPRDSEWTLVQRNNVYLNGEDWCLAHRNGQIILCALYRWCVLSTVKAEAAADDRTWNWMPAGEPGKFSVSSHLVESREELLFAVVQVDRDLILNNNADDVGSLVAALSFSMYTLQSSFVVDAARLDMSRGGCAYFLGRRKVYGGVWNKVPVRCHAFKRKKLLRRHH